MEAIAESGIDTGQPSNLTQTLPSRYYTDPAIYEEEKEKIFYRHWQCIGHVCMARNPGDYFTHKVADEELLIVRGKDDLLRAFYNVCRHRAHPLAEGKGNCRLLVCPYHAWTYELDGRLRGAPNSKSAPEFDSSKIHLNEVQLETFCGLIFVNLGGGELTVKSLFGEIEEEIRSVKPDIEDLRLITDYPVVHNCNWKASVENFAECYHCPSVHPYLTRNVIDPQAYRVEVDGLIQRHYCRGREDIENQRIWHLWPNTAVGVYPIPNLGRVLCTRHMYPLDHCHTDYHYRWYADESVPDEPILEYAQHHMKTTGAEDAAVAGAVQRGLASRGYDRGYLFSGPDAGPFSEVAVAKFQSLVLEALGHPLSAEAL
jgi:phenylpropionate dioxygenase-like ring-hydroxylating dioxygenase large terminal subunit